MIAVGRVAVFAFGCSMCSISHKDVLAKTVDIGRRGAVSGVAGSVAAAVTLLLAVAYSAGWLLVTVPVVAGAVIVGGTSWLLAALVFESIGEYRCNRRRDRRRGGVFGVIAYWCGIGTVMMLFALMAALAIVAASGLDEVQMAGDRQAHADR